MPSGRGLAEKARPTVQSSLICSFAGTVPGAKPMSTETTSPWPRGPSAKVGSGFSPVPPEATLHGTVELGLPALHST